MSHSGWDEGGMGGGLLPMPLLLPEHDLRLWAEFESSGGLVPSMQALERNGRAPPVRLWN